MRRVENVAGVPVARFTLNARQAQVNTAGTDAAARRRGKQSDAQALAVSGCSEARSMTNRYFTSLRNIRS